jgi:Tol biopolymer transport system component/predicted Ser/Thr protein kinase
MALEPGTNLGPYEIVELRGKGGMGEVYRARDTRLGREVAVKVISSEIDDGGTFRERLQREAKAISQLQHPHICTLFDIGSSDGVDYLVMEYLEGETLEDRLARGRLETEQVSRVGTEIAVAIAAAHRAGIVHRDLKPGNVIDTKTGVKVLDFGLAKGAGDGALSAATQAPTIAAPLTTEGSIVGTLQYMSPEQLEGREPGPPSDLWALGCVLYEIATGEPAFAGGSAASVIAAVMTSRPAPASERATGIPPRLDWLIERCLDRDPERRWQSAQDLALELETLGESLEGPGHREAVIPEGGAAGGVEPEVVRASLEWPVGVRAVQWQVVPGTEGAFSPFFSPDGEWLAFFAAGWLQKVPAAGGSPVLIREYPYFWGSGATWGENDEIVVAPSMLGTGLVRLSADGRNERALTSLDAENSEWHHAWPQFLPDGEHVLFTVWGWKTGGAVLVSLESGERKQVLRGAMGARLIRGDRLVFKHAFGADLRAVRFDLETLEVTGEPKSFSSDVYQAPRSGGSGSFSVSRTGTFVYEPAGSARRHLVWLDREGGVSERLETPGPYESPAVSPDGDRLAFQLNDPVVRPGSGSTGSGGDVWVHDLVRGTRDRLTGRGDNMCPVWTPDGRRIVFSSNRSGPWNIFWKDVDREGEAELLVETSVSVFPSSWSPDGSVLAYQALSGDGRKVGFVSRDGELLPHTLSRFSEAHPVFAPDGRYLAYTGYASGSEEIYVQPFPPTGERRMISNGGGSDARWAPSGQEIFYRRGDEVWLVPIETEPALRPGRAELLFSAPFEVDFIPMYDVSKDGQRLLIVEREPSRALRLVVGWGEELDRLVPGAPGLLT